MIARVWTAEAQGRDGEAYARFFRGFVKEMRQLPGFLGAQLLRRRVSTTTHITVVSYWKSMKSIEAFAGRPVDRAHVEPEARRLLSRVGRRVHHFDSEQFEGPGTPATADAGRPRGPSSPRR
jgi:heme-degrading monooxygenase HmoA